MSLTEQVYTRARLMAQELTEENAVLLESVCRVCVESLRHGLRDNIGPEDCLSDFITAGAMLAIATMWEMGSLSNVAQFTAGEVSIRQSSNHISVESMRLQAQTLMRPYSKAGYVFVGV